MDSSEIAGILLWGGFVLIAVIMTFSLAKWISQVLREREARIVQAARDKALRLSKARTERRQALPVVEMAADMSPVAKTPLPLNVPEYSEAFLSDVEKEQIEMYRTVDPSKWPVHRESFWVVCYSAFRGILGLIALLCLLGVALGDLDVAYIHLGGAGFWLALICLPVTLTLGTLYFALVWGEWWLLILFVLANVLFKVASKED